MNYFIALSKKYFLSYSGLPKACWNGILLAFIDALTTGIIFFLTIYFVTRLKISIVIAGNIISCYGIGTIIGGILGGKLSDHFSEKSTSTISLAIQAIAFYLLSQSENILIISINLFLIGICTYTFMTANSVWLIKQCQNEKSLELKVINISRATSNLALGISGIIISLIGANQFKTFFFFSSIALVIAVFYFYISHNNSALIHVNNPLLKKDPQIFLGKKNNLIFYLILLCLFSSGLIISQLGSTYPVYIEKSFSVLGIYSVGALFILDTILIVLFQVPLLHSLQNINKFTLVGGGSFLMGLGMVALNFPLGFIGAVISCVIWTTGEILFIPSIQLICYELGTDKKKGQIMGAYQTISALSKIIGPSLGGFVYYTFGTTILWSIGFLIGIFCLALCSICGNFAHKALFINCNTTS